MPARASVMIFADESPMPSSLVNVLAFARSSISLGSVARRVANAREKAFGRGV